MDEHVVHVGVPCRDNIIDTETTLVLVIIATLGLAGPSLLQKVRGKTP